MELLTIRAGGFSATVDGCARDADGLWFVSMLGHQQAVRAIWARLVKGEAAYLSETELGGQPVPLAREAWGTWRFSGLRLPSGSAYHGMLVPELAAFAANRRDFLLLARDGTRHLTSITASSTAASTCRSHSSWAEWLWSRGLENGEVETLISVGVHAFRCRPIPKALREDIGEAVRRRVLSVHADDNIVLKAA